MRPHGDVGRILRRWNGALACRCRRRWDRSASHRCNRSYGSRCGCRWRLPFILVLVFIISIALGRYIHHWNGRLAALVEIVDRFIVAAAASKQEAVHTGAQVSALCLDALPDEHAGALFADCIGALLWSDFHGLTWATRMA